jgi:hypothetical protein
MNLPKEKKLWNIPFLLLLPPLSPPTPPPSSPPVSRLPQRSNRGKPAVRYGFHTNIVKEVSKYGEEGDAALVAELENMYEKKVFFPVLRRHSFNSPFFLTPSSKSS